MATDLPIPEADHLPLGDLLHRIRALDTVGLRQLLDHEVAHANRPAVVDALHAREEELRSGAEPSSGNPAATSVAQAPPPQAAPSASPATTGPPQNPPSHGDPTNPAQPRS